MFKRILNTTLTAAAIVLASLPAAAQPQVQVNVPLPGLEIRVGHRAPPPMRREARPHRPGRDYSWLAGSWDWQQNDWAWVPGRWDRPAEGRARWIRAHYAREGNGWRYEPAHWSNQHIVEGDDYRRWRDERRHSRGNDRDHDRDHARDDSHR